MVEDLRIELTEEERTSWRWAGVIAIRFQVAEQMLSAGPALVIHEEWSHDSETFGDGCDISIPPRVWAAAAPWIAANFHC